MTDRVKLSARIGRTLHRALLLETWRREDLGISGANLSELVEVAFAELPDDLEVFDDLLRLPSCRRALAERPQVQMQPRVTEATARRIRLVARSLSFHGSQVATVTDQQILVAGLIDLLATDPDAHNPYASLRTQRTASQRRAADRVLVGREGHQHVTDDPGAPAPAGAPAPLRDDVFDGDTTTL